MRNEELEIRNEELGIGNGEIEKRETQGGASLRLIGGGAWVEALPPYFLIVITFHRALC